jgi:proline dehydrogenase
MLRGLVARPLRLALDIAGRVYVPGTALADALAIARRLAGEGTGCTLGYFQSPTDSPEAVANVTLSIVDAVAGLAPPGYASIKVPALGYDATLLGQVVAEVRRRGALAHFDSHQHATADATLRCVEQAVAQHGAVGLTLPGRWRRSVADADFACRLGVRARVVKGEWGDPADPQRDRRGGFLDVVDRLAGRARDVAVATHDPWLAREAIVRLQAKGTRCELELLHGLPRRRVLAAVHDLAVPVRIYVPFGVSWRPYAMSKVAENPRMLWWVARDAVTGLVAGIARHR